MVCWLQCQFANPLSRRASPGGVCYNGNIAFVNTCRQRQLRGSFGLSHSNIAFSSFAAFAAPSLLQLWDFVFGICINWGRKVWDHLLRCVVGPASVWRASRYIGSMFCFPAFARPPPLSSAHPPSPIYFQSGTNSCFGMPPGTGP